MQVKMTIDIIDPQGTVTGYQSDDQTNTSRLSKLSIPSPGAKLFYLSEDPNLVTSPLDGEHLWADDNEGYSGWVSNTYSDADGKFPEGQEPTITVNGEGIKYLILYSDLIEKHFLEVVEVNGLTYTGIDERLIIALEEETTQVTIKVIKVSEPYQPVKVTSIEVGLSLDFEDEQIINYDFGSQSQSNSDTIEFTVLSRYGSIELDNSDKLFNNLNDLDLLDTDIDAKVYLNNKKFGTYILRNGNLRYGGTSVEFELNDELLDIDQLVWNKAYYMEENVSAKTFLNFIFNFIGKTYNTYDTITDNVLNNTIFANTIIEEDNIKAVLVKICEATQCSIFKNNEGKIVIKYLETNNSEVV